MYHATRRSQLFGRPRALSLSLRRCGSLNVHYSDVAQRAAVGMGMGGWHVRASAQTPRAQAPLCAPSGG
eukprot:CAMPEP_0174708204 /NCGR_PEP_ID=MMETSP1094-20130205/10522_1 /TAXON_ID=156173 /ORGANISM="Chrysochromulina brevifilum, Strain UTEX LB 985" /LENGTH=68 /DNA_ID=CAMNT_0015906721 /DNA_START=395 /DNA_END=601 /DNA_ORIENTATION=-